MATGKQPRVVTACTMLKRMLFRYQGYVSAALVLGGVDCKGPHLYTVYPHGSTDSLPYVTMGSGSLNAMAVFESEYKSKMTEDTCQGEFIVYKDGDLNYPIVEERVWERNAFHYDNVAKAMLTLFVVSTFEGSYFLGGY